MIYQDCGMNVCWKCRDSVPKTCTKYKSVTRDLTSDHLAGQVGGQSGGHFSGHDSIGYNYAGHQPDEHGNITCQVSTEFIISDVFQS